MGGKRKEGTKGDGGKGREGVLQNLAQQHMCGKTGSVSHINKSKISRPRSRPQNSRQRLMIPDLNDTITKLMHRQKWYL